MMKVMPDWFEKEDMEDLKKILDKIIRKMENRRCKMQEIEKDAQALKDVISDTKENDAGFTRVQFVALMSIMKRFLYVNKQDGEEVERKLKSLEEMKTKLSKLKVD